MRCIVQLNDGSYINVQADRMEVQENMLYVWDGDRLVALADIAATIAARLEKLK